MARAAQTHRDRLAQLERDGAAIAALDRMHDDFGSSSAAHTAAAPARPATREGATHSVTPAAGRRSMLDAPGEGAASSAHGARCMQQRGMRDTAFGRREGQPALSRTDSAASGELFDGVAFNGTSCDMLQAAKQTCHKSGIGVELGHKQRLTGADMAPLMIDNALFEPV